MSDGLKICFCASGKSIHVQRWINAFMDMGHEVHLVSDVEYNYKTVKFHRIKNYTPNRYLNLLIGGFRIKKLLEQIKPDILHSHYAPTYGLLGALSGYHPFINTVWGSDVLNSKTGIKKALVRFVLDKADRVTTTAEFMGDYLNKEFEVPKKKITRIPIGIDTKIFRRGYAKEARMLREQLGIGANTPVILSNRNILPVYQIEKIIEAIPHVTLRYSDAKFIFLKGFGSTEYEKKIVEKAKKTGVAKNAIFISELLKSEEMAAYLNMADTFISIPKTDQFASCIMEGMACGTIPVVSDIKPYKQYLEDDVNAFFVDPMDPIEISEKIIYCIENPGLKDRFYSINRKIIEENEDWEDNIKKMVELYESLAKA